MVSVKKKGILKSLEEQIEKYPVVGILDMHKLPARQLYQIKEQLKDKAVIRMAKKRVIMLALQKSKKDNISKLAEVIENQPAMLFSEDNPFELAQVIAASKSKASARPGDVAPYDIIVPEGPTNLPPGPAIGELQRAKIQAGVEGDKIVVKKEAVVAKKGVTINAQLADLLTKLGIEPIEISLNLLAVWDDGMILNKDLLFIPKEHYVGQLQSGYSAAFNLAVNIGFATPDTVPVLLTKAHREAVALATEAGIMTSETIGPVLAKAEAQAEALKALVKDAPEPVSDEKPAEEKKDAKDGESKEKPLEEGGSKEESPSEEKIAEPASEEKEEKKSS